MNRRTLAALAAPLLAVVSGCASLIPVGPVLEGMSDRDVDVVVAKVVGRYEQVAHVPGSEPFVFVIDSVVVGGDLREPGDRALVRTIASYMLGESTGAQWPTRTESERAVFGEGQVQFIVYRAPAGDRFFLDVLGAFALFLPLARAGAEGPGGVEALSFDIRASSQEIDFAKAGDAVDIYCEILPRGAVYTANGPVFKRWSNALFQLGLGAPGGAADPAGEARGQEDRVRGFLKNTRGHVGPVVKLGVHLAREPGGTVAFALGVPDAVSIVLPASLLAGDRAAERALARVASALPGAVTRAGDDLLLRVGYFFFHADATGPADARASEAAAAAKRVRILPVERK